MKKYLFSEKLFFLPFVIALLVLFAVRGGAVRGPFFGGSEQLTGFTITAYCPGRCCNGPWAYQTSNGKNMAWYIGRGIHIAATDPKVIPHGKRFRYGGIEYLAIDRGAAIKGKRIDLLLYSHAETIRFGIKHDQSIKLLH